MTSGSFVQANLKTARPFICGYMLRSSYIAGGARWGKYELPGAGSQSCLAPLPSAWRQWPRKPFVGSSVGPTTIAAAPSPKSTVTSRPASLKSSPVEWTSVPMTSTCLLCPTRMKASAVLRLYSSPVHWFRMSMQAVPGRPNRSWTKQAVPGKSWSGERLATRMVSMSDTSSPASAIAARAAFSPIAAGVSSGVE